jgi:hypothetical protein
MGSIIAQNSILCRLPRGLDSKQNLFLDGIHHLTEIIHLAYSRLPLMPTEMALTAIHKDELPRWSASAFLDMWATVDAINRLIALEAGTGEAGFAACIKDENT